MNVSEISFAGRPDPEDNDDRGPACPWCGADMEIIECDRCGGDGWTEPDEIEPCGQCNATVFYACVNSVEWCKAHPLPGHENADRYFYARSAR